MNISTVPDKHSPIILRFLETNYPPFIMVLLLGVLAIRNNSLWGDEFATVCLATPIPWGDWIIKVMTWPDSDAQLPFYDLYMRAWFSVFPITEYWLRFSNMPWLFVTLFSLWCAPINPKQKWLAKILAIIVFVHPLTWYYANEGRQYAMLLAGSALALSGLLALLDFETGRGDETRGNTFIILGVTLLLVTSLTGALWSIAFAGPAIILNWNRYRWSLGLTKSQIILVFTCITLIILPLLVYYKYALDRGAEPAHMGNNLLNYFFAFYEISGLSGLGPGRLELRAAAAEGQVYHALKPYIVSLVLGAISIFAIFAYGIHYWCRQNCRQFFLTVVFVLIPLGILAIEASIKDFRVVGRHIIPVMLPYCLILAMGAYWMVSNVFTQHGERRVTFAILGITYVAMIVLSTISISFAGRHQKDDFKKAVQHARSSLENGERVWWAAAHRALSYYGTYEPKGSECFGVRDERNNIFIINDLGLDQIIRCPRPDVIFISSRKDNYDSHGTGFLQDFLKHEHYQMTDKWIGFEVWHKSEEGVAK